MNKFTAATSLIALAMVFLPLSASSEVIPDRGPIPFSAYDKDGDGFISKKEFSDVREKRMKQCQGRCKGGYQGRGNDQGMKRSKAVFSDFDLNGDGQILEQEFNEARSKRIKERAEQGYKMKNLGKAPSFSDIDKNGDGKINSEEFSAHQTQRR